MFQTPKGTRDFLPEQMKKYQYVCDTIRRVYESYGFGPLETPVFEYFELLAAKGSGGEAIKDEIYYFKDKSDRELGLRYDLTVPLARVVATNPSLPKPFKRYCISRVWRYDQPQAMRYREFTQADIDIVGSEGTAADVEVLCAAVDCLRALGFQDAYVRVNNRKLLWGLALTAGVPEKRVPDALRSIDKADKIGWEGVKKELDDKEISAKIISLIVGKGFKDVKAQLDNDMGKEGACELDELSGMLKDAGLGDYVKIDVTLVRGLEYYTGNVFEVMAGGNISSGGGGRYDKLIEVYGGQPTPAVGISFGVDRLMQLMEERGLFKMDDVLVFVAPIKADVYNEAFKIAKMLRDAGIKTNIDLMGRKLNKQLEYASAIGAKYAVIVGPKELAEKSVTLRDMKSGEQKKVGITGLVSELRVPSVPVV